MWERRYRVSSVLASPLTSAVWRARKSDGYLRVIKVEDAKLDLALSISMMMLFSSLLFSHRGTRRWGKRCCFKSIIREGIKWQKWRKYEEEKFNFKFSRIIGLQFRDHVTSSVCSHWARLTSWEPIERRRHSCISISIINIAWNCFFAPRIRSEILDLWRLFDHPLYARILSHLCSIIDSVNFLPPILYNRNIWRQITRIVLLPPSVPCIKNSFYMGQFVIATSLTGRSRKSELKSKRAKQTKCSCLDYLA